MPGRPGVCSVDRMLIAKRTLCPLAVNEDGEFFEPPQEVHSWLLKRVTGGCPAVVYDGSQPATVARNATRKDVIEVVNRVCTVRAYPLDKYHEIIPDVPVGIVEITAEDLGFGAQAQHWMRLDRVFDTVDRMMSAMESKDMLMAQTTQALIESHTALQSGAVRMLEASSGTINVANGIARPELNFDVLAERMVSRVKEAQGEPRRVPWFVQLLNGNFGEVVGTVISHWTGQPIPSLSREDAGTDHE